MVVVFITKSPAASKYHSFW